MPADSPTPRKPRPSYIGELTWAIGKAICANGDRNPNRWAQMNAMLHYANDVLIARRSRSECPPRPKMEELV